MRTALLVSLVYALLLTVGVLSRERPFTDSLKGEMAMSLERDIARSETLTVAHRHTLFSGIVTDDLRARALSDQDTTRSERLLSVATASACNPRIAPCF